MRVHRQLSPEMRTWLSQWNGPLRVFENYAAGFSR